MLSHLIETKRCYNKSSKMYSTALKCKVLIKLKNKKYLTIGTIPKSNIKIVERGKINTPNIKIHDRPLSWLGTGASIKGGVAKLALWAQTPPLSEMMRSCCVPHESNCDENISVSTLAVERYVYKIIRQSNKIGFFLHKCVNKLVT